MAIFGQMTSIYDNLNPKLAIYAANVEEAVNECCFGRYYHPDNFPCTV